MKRIWNLALGTAVLCTALLCGCALSGPTAPDSAAPTDPLTGQERHFESRLRLQWPVTEALPESAAA